MKRGPAGMRVLAGRVVALQRLESARGGLQFASCLVAHAASARITLCSESIPCFGDLSRNHTHP